MDEPTLPLAWGDMDLERIALLRRLRAAVSSDPTIAKFAIGWLLADCTDREISRLMEALDTFSVAYGNEVERLKEERFGAPSRLS